MTSERFLFEARQGRLTLRLEAVPMGRDLTVALSGGDHPHIGAVALSQPRASLAPGGPRSASTSVLTLLGHKEDDLARNLAARLAAALDTTVCVTCGIHLDQVLPEELVDVAALAEGLATDLVSRLLPG